MKEPVRLEGAWRWTCVMCEHVNWEESVTCEFSEEDSHEMAALHGFEFQTGDWVSQPEEVQCCKCGHEYSVEQPSEAEDDE
jgi:hypothetical protein